MIVKCCATSTVTSIQGGSNAGRRGRSTSTASVPSTLCSLRGCFIHREHSFLDASHAAFVESSTMWPYACLSDCKVMVKCVESDGKVIATHVSVQSHCQPVRPDREGCCHPSCVSCMRRRQAVDWVHALPSLHGRVIRVCPIARMYASVTVLGRWDRFHSLPPAATPGTFMCCHGACRCPDHVL